MLRCLLLALAMAGIRQPVALQVERRRGHGGDLVVDGEHGWELGQDVAFVLGHGAAAGPVRGSEVNKAILAELGCELFPGDGDGLGKLP